jgi:hypothetical protein
MDSFGGLDSGVGRVFSAMMILMTVCQQFLLLGLDFLMESLILAQDERWRRA